MWMVQRKDVFNWLDYKGVTRDTHYTFIELYISFTGEFLIMAGFWEHLKYKFFWCYYLLFIQIIFLHAIVTLDYHVMTFTDTVLSFPIVADWFGTVWKGHELYKSWHWMWGNPWNRRWKNWQQRLLHSAHCLHWCKGIIHPTPVEEICCIQSNRSIFWHLRTVHVGGPPLGSNQC